MYKHMGKVVIKILQGSAVTQTVLGGLTIIISSGCKFPIVYMCQKLWKLAGSRQSYCNNYLAYFFWPTLYTQMVYLPEYSPSTIYVRVKLIISSYNRLTKG